MATNRIGLVVGVAIGLIFGAMLNNIDVGIAVDAVLELVIGFGFKEKEKKEI